MASTITSRILEIDNEIIRNSLTDFQNVEHRLEFVTKVHGISFINDSKATNVNAAWYGLEATSAPIVWIVGGEDKGNKYRTLLPLVKEKVKAIVCLGLDNEKIRKNFNRHVDEFVETDSMSKAIIAAYSIAKRGDSVLLSPACASFDLFESYEDRGRQFKECVRAL
ncbi:MAG: glutamate ligase domain-containing protein [Flavobacteriales bacterium]